jgi:hypothetical protein
MGKECMYAPALGLDSRGAKCTADLIQYKTKQPQSPYKSIPSTKTTKLKHQGYL